MRVTVTRRGGIAGVALRGSADAEQFPGAADVLRSHAGRAASSPPRPDAFTYEVEFDGEHVALGEHDVPPEVQPLVDKAMESSEIV